MLGFVKPITAVFDGKNRELVVPVYQRNYDWQIKHCSQLFDDLELMMIEGKPKHFFGSIVGKSESSFKWIVIDGQQRLTSTSLLILALAESLKSGEIESEDPELARKIVEDYLRVGDGHQEKFKLKPVKNDAAAYSRLFRGETEFMEDSNVTNNYRFFRKRLRQTTLTGDQVWKAIEQLEIMHLDLESHDNPQRIFESLNSTGLELSEADKIRNFILMGMKKRDQDEIYENRWNPIEKFADFQTDRFIRWFLTSKTGRIPRQDDVYEAFKSFAQSYSHDTKALVGEMYRYAEYFFQLRNAKTSYPAVNHRLRRAQRVLGDVVLPFLMPVLWDADDEVITPDDLLHVVEIVESYFFRRFAASVPTNALNKVFASAYGELRRLWTGAETYTDLTTYLLRRRESSGRFPSDDEFSEGFATRDFYSARSEYKQYIFDYLENGDSADTLDIAQKLETSEISVEHIMPQRLSDWWKNSLGENYNTIHETWVNRIGNLTITGYNSSYSNSPFPKKKEMANGFNHTPYRLNRFVQQCTSWGLAEIESRTEILVSQALNIWKLPSTDFRPPEAVLDNIPMGEDANFRGRKIVKFTYSDVTETVASWAEMLPEIIRILAESHRSQILNFTVAGNKMSADPTIIENLPEGWRKIDAGLAVEASSSTQTKIDLLRRLFEYLDLDPHELVFTLRPVDKGEPSDSEEEASHDFITKFLPELEEARALQSSIEETVVLQQQLRDLLGSQDNTKPRGVSRILPQVEEGSISLDNLSEDRILGLLDELGQKVAQLTAIDKSVGTRYLHDYIVNGTLAKWISRLVP